MNDTWFQWLLGAAAAVVAWLGKRFWDKLDTCVSRSELASAINEMRQERRDMHLENRDTLNRIHERVDELWDRTFGR